MSETPAAAAMGSPRLMIVPCTISDAKVFVGQVHRHLDPPDSGLYAVAVAAGELVVGVAIVGRPVARGLQDGFTAEIVRLATDGTKNACSMLYAAAWRAARSLGYRKLVTYTLAAEPGTSVRAAGWTQVGAVRGRPWHTATRPRVERAPAQDKLRWEVQA